MKYRIVLHSDTEGFPNHWLIQKKGWFTNGWKFKAGFFSTKRLAEYFLEKRWFPNLTVNPPLNEWPYIQ